MKNNTIYQKEELDPYILRVVGFYTLLFNKKNLTVFIAGLICDAVNNSEDRQLELMNDFNEIMSYYKDYIGNYKIFETIDPDLVVWSAGFQRLPLSETRFHAINIAIEVLDTSNNTTVSLFPCYV